MATIYCNASDLASNVAHMSDEMRMYCKTKQCRRQVLMQYFGFEAVSVDPKHLCCDNCSESCSCEDCQHLQDPELILDEFAAALCSTPVEPNEEAITTIRRTLENYFKSENSVVNEPLPELLTSLCASLASEIASDYVNIKHHQRLINYEHVRECYAENILGIVNYVYDQFHN